jgi:hypothetical protein
MSILPRGANRAPDASEDIVDAGVVYGNEYEYANRALCGLTGIVQTRLGAGRRTGLATKRCGHNSPAMTMLF